MLGYRCELRIGHGVLDRGAIGGDFLGRPKCKFIGRRGEAAQKVTSDKVQR